MMNLSKVRSKLEAFNKPKQKYEKIDFTKVYWKPNVGKHQIRIIPSKFDKENPFREIYFHYGLAKFPILSLINWEEKDPIVEFAKELRKSKEPEDWQLAKKISPKQRVFIPILVRGEEEKGVRLWEVGVIIYKQLLAIADDEDYGDYTSITNGRDFTIEVIEENKFDKIIKTVSSIRVKPKTSSITDNADNLEKYLNEQPDVLSLGKKNTFEELESILKKFLGEDEEATEIKIEEVKDDLPFEVDAEDELIKEIPKNNYKAEKNKKQIDKFDELFQEASDDLPF